MRIVWLSHLVPFPPAGGARQRAFGLLSQVATRHEVVFTGFNQSSICPRDRLQDALAGLSEYCTVDFVDDIPSDGSSAKRYSLAARSLFTRLPYTVNWLAKPAYQQRFAELLRKFQPDLIHVDTVSLAPYRELAPNTPAALNHHNVESAMLLRRAELEGNAVRSAYYRQEGTRLQRYEAEIATRYDVHLMCSDLDAMRWAEIAPSTRVEVVPNGVDTQYFRPSAPPPPRTPRTAVFAGGLSWYPNVSAVRFLVEQVWPRISETDARLTICGREPPSWLHDAAARDPRIIVTGWVDDVRPYIESASVYVCPIFDGGGTKLKVLDALALGIPLIAHPIACEGIRVTNGENVVYAETAEDFVAAIRNVWSRPDDYAPIGARGVDLIKEQYDIIGIGRRLADCYEEIAMNARGTPRNRTARAAK